MNSIQGEQVKKNSRPEEFKGVVTTFFFQKYASDIQKENQTK